MRPIEIWPDEIVGRDTEREGKSCATFRFIDHEAETAVVAFLQRGMIADLYRGAEPGYDRKSELTCVLTINSLGGVERQRQLLPFTGI